MITQRTRQVPGSPKRLGFSHRTETSWVNLLRHSESESRYPKTLIPSWRYWRLRRKYLRVSVAPRRAPEEPAVRWAANAARSSPQAKRPAGDSPAPPGAPSAGWVRRGSVAAGSRRGVAGSHGVEAAFSWVEVTIPGHDHLAVKGLSLLELKRGSLRVGRRAAWRRGAARPPTPPGSRRGLRPRPYSGSPWPGTCPRSSWPRGRCTGSRWS